ncbi:hypothetical protein ACQQ91_08765, partial [Selenomonas bovis]|uniref:hypothetical protein n=1 Tax=Selenomonas bovis TaxID=416586 RepID=UPI003CFF1B90
VYLLIISSQVIDVSSHAKKLPEKFSHFCQNHDAGAVLSIRNPNGNPMESTGFFHLHIELIKHDSVVSQLPSGQA